MNEIQQQPNPVTQTPPTTPANQSSQMTTDTSSSKHGSSKKLIVVGALILIAIASAGAIFFGKSDLYKGAASLPLAAPVNNDATQFRLACQALRGQLQADKSCLLDRKVRIRTLADLQKYAACRQSNGTWDAQKATCIARPVPPVPPPPPAPVVKSEFEILCIREGGTYNAAVVAAPTCTRTLALGNASSVADLQTRRAFYNNCTATPKAVATLEPDNRIKCMLDNRLAVYTDADLRVGVVRVAQMKHQESCRAIGGDPTGDVGCVLVKATPADVERLITNYEDCRAMQMQWNLAGRRCDVPNDEGPIDQTPPASFIAQCQKAKGTMGNDIDGAAICRATKIGGDFTSESELADYNSRFDECAAQPIAAWNMAERACRIDEGNAPLGNNPADTFVAECKKALGRMEANANGNPVCRNTRIGGDFTEESKLRSYNNLFDTCSAQEDKEWVAAEKDCKLKTVAVAPVTPPVEPDASGNNGAVDALNNRIHFLEGQLAGNGSTPNMSDVYAEMRRISTELEALKHPTVSVSATQTPASTSNPTVVPATGAATAAPAAQSATVALPSDGTGRRTAQRPATRNRRSPPEVTSESSTSTTSAELTDVGSSVEPQSAEINATQNAAGATNSNSSESALRGAYIEGRARTQNAGNITAGTVIRGNTGPEVLLYPIIAGLANGAYWLARKRKKRA